jgi:hypothetical protein
MRTARPDEDDDLLMSGTACSRRVRAGESQSYTVLDLNGERLQVRVRHWGGDRFTTQSHAEWRRTADGWHARR